MRKLGTLHINTFSTMVSIGNHICQEKNNPADGSIQRSSLLFEVSWFPWSRCVVITLCAQTRGEEGFHFSPLIHLEFWTRHQNSKTPRTPPFCLVNARSFETCWIKYIILYSIQDLQNSGTKANGLCTRPGQLPDRILGGKGGVHNHTPSTTV